MFPVPLYVFHHFDVHCLYCTPLLPVLAVVVACLIVGVAGRSQASQRIQNRLVICAAVITLLKFDVLAGTPVLLRHSVV